MRQVMGEAMSTPFDLVLGRKTYDIYATYWPHATDEITPQTKFGYWSAIVT